MLLVVVGDDQIATHEVCPLCFDLRRDVRALGLKRQRRRRPARRDDG